MAISKKTKRWLANNILPTFEGKTVLITGATGGVGLKTAEIMLYLNANVIMACRNIEKAENIKKSLLYEYPNAKIDIYRVDLADFSSIDSFVGQIETEGADIDVFVNNAGVFHKPGELTADGFDMVIGTNYLGVYYLSKKILPYFKTLNHEVFYINTISIIHKIGNIDYNDFFCKEKYSNLKVYGRSKISLAKYTYYLATRFKNSNIRIFMNHPGITITALGINAYGKKIERLAKIFGKIFNSNEKSALSVAYILSNDISTGSIVGPDKFLGGWGYPKVNKTRKKVKTGGKELVLFTENLINKQTKN